MPGLSYSDFVSPAIRNSADKISGLIHYSFVAVAVVAVFHFVLGESN